MSDAEQDARPWLKLDQSFPDNPKVMPLTDGAFRLYITALCWTARNNQNGELPKGVLRALGSTARVRELVSSGLLDESDGVFRIHDYLKHQMSAAEVTAYKKARRADGSFGAHIRHHVRDKKPNGGCPHCIKEGLIPRGSA